MANEQLYNQRADHYHRARPGYAPDAINFIFEHILPPSAIVADIGSGTGIFSQQLLNRKIVTYCVEPNPQMRAKAELRFANNTLFHSVPASAEHTGLKSHMFTTITVASAFHWFNANLFRQECQRLLKKEGIVCILLNARDPEDPLTRAQHLLCQEFCPGFSSLRHGLEKTEREMPAFFGQELHRESFLFPLHYHKEKFIERSLSSSYAPDPNDPRYAAYTKALWKLIDNWTDQDSLTVKNETVIFWGKLIV